LRRPDSKYVVLVAFWCVTVVASLVWNMHDHQRSINRILIDRGRSLFEMILIQRQWNAEHGGVYVPVTELSQPNPYLIDSLRDISCTGGMELTKINPSYMTRQVSELSGSESSVHFHITSLSPMRPGNEADEWESEALRSFEEGKRETFGLVSTEDQKESYRYMAPLYTEQSCLECHAEQGYQVGDVRGGISVGFAADEINSASREHTLHMGAVHISGLLVGVVFIIFFARFSQRADLRIERERRRFQELVELTTAVHWEVDMADMRFTYISPKVEAMLGYPRSSWKDVDFWAGAIHTEDRETATSHCRESTARGQDHVFTYRAISADGREVWIRNIVNVIKDEQGRPVKLRGLFVDDTELKTAEARLLQSLSEKEVLLKEVHHRVKNNMAVIISLQRLQEGRLEEGAAKEALAENTRRIRAMALVHELIYQSDDLASVDAGEYLENLGSYIASAYDFPFSGLGIDVDFSGGCEDLDTLIPLGLIVNELLSNAMKHAFDSYEGAMINISLRCDEGGRSELIVSDNGRGMPVGLTTGEPVTLGLRIIKALVSQLEGSLEIRSEGGTAFHIMF